MYQQDSAAATADGAIVAVLATVGIFEHLSADELQRVAGLGQRRSFATGETLMEQGEPGDCLHTILSGCVRVERSQPEGGEPLFVAELGSGETVGEMGVLNNTARSASVVATEPTETLELGSDAVTIILADYPDVAAALLRLMSERLRSTTVLNALRIVHDTLSRERAEAAAREEVVRLQGVLLAARTLQHHINNHLALTVGYGELLASDARLPAELREWARLAAAGSMAAAETVRKLQRITELRRDPTQGAEPFLLPD